MKNPTPTPLDTVGEAGATPPARTLSAWLFAVIGVAAALVGLLPWLITGMRLPLQNLWASETMPGDMPLVLLPFSQYAIVLIAALLITGGAVAGIVGRATRARQSRGAFLALLLGVILVHVISIVQTARVVASGLQDRGEATIYLVLLTTVAVLGALMGMLVLVLIARAPRAGALIGLTLAALALDPWLGGLLAPLGSMPNDFVLDVLGLLRWVAPILVGIAIAWCGVGSAGRIAAAVGSLALLWIAPATLTAVTSAAGSRVLARDLPGMLEYGLSVFEMALFEPSLALPPLVVAVVVATLGLVIRAASRQRQPAASESATRARVTSEKLADQEGRR